MKPSSSLSSSHCFSLVSPLPPSLDGLLEELTQLSADEKRLKARREEILDLLDQLVQEGEAEEQITWNDYKITRRQRISWVYSEAVTNLKQDLDRQLKQAQEIDQFNGDAVRNVTTYWEVRQPRP